jgi:hypothetical protein
MPPTRFRPPPRRIPFRSAKTWNTVHVNVPFCKLGPKPNDSEMGGAQRVTPMFQLAGVHRVHRKTLNLII